MFFFVSSFGAVVEDAEAYCRTAYWSLTVAVGVSARDVLASRPGRNDIFW